MSLVSLPPVPAARAALLDWCAQNGIGPRQLATDLRCEYKHAWAILRSDYRITLFLIGRLLIHYGVTGPAPAMAAAFKTELDRLYDEEQ